MRTLQNETQQFIGLLKDGKSVRDALIEMTYGYEDPEAGVIVVDEYTVTKRFFGDYLRCCDNPQYEFDMLTHSIEFQEFEERFENIEPTTEREKMVYAMRTILMGCRVRNNDGTYCNGFTSEIER